MQPQTQILAWQGWSLAVPATWNPVRVEGDADSGSMLLADLMATRIGVQWRHLSKKVAIRVIDKGLGDPHFAANPTIDPASGLCEFALRRALGATGHGA